MSNKPIHIRVLEAAADFERKMGDKVTTVYLGYDEYRLLSQWLDKQYGAPITAAQNKVWDYQVLYVPTKSHLAVSGYRELA